MATEVRQRKGTKETSKGDDNDDVATFPAFDNNIANLQQWSWTDLSSWPLSVRWAPAFVVLLVAFVAVYWNHYITQPPLDMSTQESCTATFNFTFPMHAARHQAEQLSTHSWEIGTAWQAIEELVNPEKTVFSADPFPENVLPKQGLIVDQALSWVYQKIRTDGETLFEDAFSVADPVSLGVPALMLSQRFPRFKDAADRQLDYLLNAAPRYINGAISHRRDEKELWSDALSMFPPFLAYYGATGNQTEMLQLAFRQIQLYRDVLQFSHGPKIGLWMHIKGPSELADEGAWSTGNGWAAYGMARVRATMAGWAPGKPVLGEEIEKLDQYIGEILDAAMRADTDNSGLLRNYLDQESWFGETSGTSLLAATAYRMALQNPRRFGEQYIAWADRKREAVLATVDNDGFAKPAVNPLKHGSRDPVEDSPEGESFLIMMGAAWRDCVCAGTCAVPTYE
ncbi:hypothetical protein KC332_g16576 [Hortaea werneckii]|uniref:Linalool dehydratase/isomerase domain-containing protein n=2 Tax=Hortaea werneckii TaxID=91943 RepID=A0A3M7HHT5_HORWE|nr:hypothetical protein KC358_g8571 [Hortaea werneckii]OTA37109.1 hypothetical protein BTJ68_03136 [Hortaea werneckii EXF-2000]KAI6828739.1 hypothetical protein KC350_g8008 [Hortaea werneckii]KAI6925409.1 hypothetical protein KC348_g8983 [Hortaea werneckii]KAI6932913.1 hypothetical protein KC341_g8680 [Hortaea werneckii]